ncbi:hypothetical protein QBC35DRAFT_61366 [Podospora australis]|uniref:Uncharacterized protein n=1 Tax=Podospora australis TaxID=1536484 RepID=A0AAN6X375_9PEZI|nr:hypothetical protein QBC35DRAFT_61366 [Podospora australis]
MLSTMEKGRNENLRFVCLTFSLASLGYAGQPMIPNLPEIPGHGRCRPKKQVEALFPSSGCSAAAVWLFLLGNAKQQQNPVRRTNTWYHTDGKQRSDSVNRPLLVASNMTGGKVGDCFGVSVLPRTAVIRSCVPSLQLLIVFLSIFRSGPLI